MKWQQIPRKGWVSLGCFIVGLTLVPVALVTDYLLAWEASFAFSGFGWGIIYALPSNSDKQTRSE